MGLSSALSLGAVGVVAAMWTLGAAAIMPTIGGACPTVTDMREVSWFRARFEVSALTAALAVVGAVPLRTHWWTFLPWVVADASRSWPQMVLGCWLGPGPFGKTFLKL